MAWLQSKQINPPVVPQNYNNFHIPENLRVLCGNLSPLKKSILFIVNPISGGKDKTGFPKLVEQHLDKNKFDVEYVYTEAEGHAKSIAAGAVANNTDIIVSVGGDGTMNEIASAVEGSGKIIGIVPYGSGNGLARSLGIPMNLKQAVRRFNNSSQDTIDSGVLNGRKFFNMAGMGFDATISTRFAEDKTRGLIGYVKTTLQEISNYKPQKYKIEVDGKLHEYEAFMLSIANSSQFGNNAHIAPSASVRDGLLDVCIIKPFPLYLFPVMGYHMFSNTADKSPYVEIVKGKKIRIIREQPGPVHVDGEPCQMGEEIAIDVKPLSLNVLK